MTCGATCGEAGRVPAVHSRLDNADQMVSGFEGCRDSRYQNLAVNTMRNLTISRIASWLSSRKCLITRYMSEVLQNVAEAIIELFRFPQLGNQLILWKT